MIAQKILNNYELYIDKVYFLESPVHLVNAGHLMQLILYIKKLQHYQSNKYVYIKF